MEQIAWIDIVDRQWDVVLDALDAHRASGRGRYHRRSLEKVDLPLDEVLDRVREARDAFAAVPVPKAGLLTPALARAAFTAVVFSDLRAIGEIEASSPLLGRAVRTIVLGRSPAWDHGVVVDGVTRYLVLDIHRLALRCDPDIAAEIVDRTLDRLERGGVLDSDTPIRCWPAFVRMWYRRFRADVLRVRRRELPTDPQDLTSTPARAIPKIDEPSSLVDSFVDAAAASHRDLGACRAPWELYQIVADHPIGSEVLGRLEHPTDEEHRLVIDLSCSLKRAERVVEVAGAAAAYLELATAIRLEEEEPAARLGLLARLLWLSAGLEPSTGGRSRRVERWLPAVAAIADPR